MSDMSTFDQTDPQAEGSDLQLWSYRSGSWYSVFGSGVAVLLPPAQKEHVAGLWALVDGGAGFDEVLDGLLASGLSRLPGFVLVSTDAGPTRVLLRGSDVSARALAPDGEVVIDGSAGGTWSERTIEGVTALTIEVEDGPDGPDFPIPAGLVRASRIDRPAVAAAPLGEASSIPVGQSTPAPGVGPRDAPVVAPSIAPVIAPAGGFGGDAVESAADTEAATELIELPVADDVVPREDTAPLEGELPAAPTSAEASPMDNDGWTEPTFAGDPLTGPLAQPTEGAAEPPAPVSPPPPPSGLPTTPPPSGPPTIAPTIAPPPPVAGSRGAGAVSVPPAAGPVAKLLVSDGQTVVVDKVVLIGRAPEARRFSVTEQPQLVTVPSRLHEISSTHIEVRPGVGADQGTAVVTDMGSTNGTVLEQPGIGPEDLKPGIAVPLVPGAVINLGDGITIQVSRP